MSRSGDDELYADIDDHLSKCDVCNALTCTLAPTCDRGRVLRVRLIEAAKGKRRAAARDVIDERICETLVDLLPWGRWLDEPATRRTADDARDVDARYRAQRNAWIAAFTDEQLAALSASPIEALRLRVDALKAALAAHIAGANEQATLPAPMTSSNNQPRRPWWRFWRRA